MTTCSMTGYGKETYSSQELTINIEIRSVNNRYLDINIKSPQCYNGFENDLVKNIKQKLSRGRVDIYITRTTQKSNNFETKFNQDVFNAYLDAAKKASEISGIKDKEIIENTIPLLLNKKEVFEVTFKDEEVETEKEILIKSLNAALDNLIISRKAEGKNIVSALLQLLQDLKEQTKKIRDLSSSEPKQYQQKVQQRINQLLASVEIDPLRLAQEVAFFADKIDITEELARLESHFQQFESILKSDKDSGKKLEFLLQEILREINTTASKAQNSEIAILTVNSKSIVEKLKEQVLNIE